MAGRVSAASDPDTTSLGAAVDGLPKVRHPWIVPDTVEQREYQVHLAVAAGTHPTLVVIPTGLGKTVVALLVLADRFARDPGSKALLLAPTKPLVEQHRAFFARHLRLNDKADVVPSFDPDTAIVAMSGDMVPEKRAEAWKAATLVVATPQVVENDLIAGRYDLRDVSCIVFDEVHRATGEYPYVWISERYERDRPDGHRLGLTASPGSSAEKILETCRNVGITRMEVRSEEDDDVRPYIHDLQMEWVKVPLPDNLKPVQDALQKAIKRRVATLRALGFLKGASSTPSRRDLLGLAGEIQSRIRLSDDPDRSLFDAMTLQAQAIKIHHALELVETQGAAGFLAYWERLRKESEGKGASKATVMVLADDRLQAAVEAAADAQEADPKADQVEEAVRVELATQDDPRIIVFANYRDTAERVRARLERIPGCRPVRFVGQSSREGDKGLTQTEQKRLLQEFRDGTHNVLVATSVAEEGLDVPQTDLVIFYEPVPSEIRAIQRRGRTARHRAGRALMLMYAGTRDESYYWSSRRREKYMRRELQSLRTIVERELERTERSRLANTATTLDTLVMNDAAARDHADGDRPTTSDGAGAHADPAATANTGTPQPTTVRRGQQRLGAGAAARSQAPAPPDQVSADVTAGPDETAAQTDAHGPDAPEGASAPDRHFAGLSPQDGGLRIVVDHREARSGVVKGLERRGVLIEPAQLQVADYAVSDRVAVERKSVDDFLDSLLDGRLFQQARQLRGYRRPIMIVEGEGLATRRNIPRNSVYGALASLATDFGISVLQTRDGDETADLLVSIARREQTETRREAPVRLDKVTMNDEEARRFIVEGLPNVSAVLARRLLDHFGSVRAVMQAGVDDLMAVDGLGRKTAEEIARVLDAGPGRRRRT